jgi:adenylate cyclase
VTAARRADLLTEAELAERTGLSPAAIRELAGLGILEPRDGGYTRRDVVRARVVRDLGALGIEPDLLARALASGHLRLGYLESAGRRHPRSDRTFADVAGEMDIPFEALERIYIAFGLPRPSADERVRQEDVEALAVLPILFGAGLGERDLLRMARVWGDSARRVAHYLPQYFHATVEQRFRARGLGDNEAYEAAIREVAVCIGRSGEGLLGWLFRRQSDGVLVAHQFDHVEAALDEAGVRPRQPRKPGAVVFADLTGYTQLTETAGDEAAAEIALSLAQLVGEVAARHRGLTVKLLGDGALLHFADPGDAVRASLDIVALAPERGLPPAHVGADAGPMLFDQGDYFGRTVNLAARIGARAAPGQVLVGETLAAAVPHDGFALTEAGAVELKGIAAPIRIFEASRASSRS